MNNGTCRGCGASIVWIKTKSGKSMPCDAEPVHYVPGGKDRAVTASGNVVSCEIVSGGGEIGYRPHWATCPNAKRFKSGMKTEKCKACGAPVIWKETRIGKVLCDAHPIHYEVGGDYVIVTEDGDTVLRAIVPSGGKLGYRPHYATCKSAENLVDAYKEK